MHLIQQETGWNTVQLADLLILIMVSSGVFGFIYEELFYKVDLGYWTKRGSSFGPWIPIYVFGGAAYTFLVYPFKASPLVVFGLCVAVSGIMEYVTGMVLYEFFDTRLWDYNVEKWNYGNINGYVCLRSVLFFGFSGLFLIYLVIPLYIRLLQNVNWNILTVICGVLAAAFIIDCTAYQIVDKRKDTSQNSKEYCKIQLSHKNLSI